MTAPYSPSREEGDRKPIPLRGRACTEKNYIYSNEVGKG